MKRTTRNNSSASIVLCNEDESGSAAGRMEVEENVGEVREAPVSGGHIPIRTVAGLVAQDPLHVQVYEEEEEEEEEEDIKHYTIEHQTGCEKVSLYCRERERER